MFVFIFYAHILERDFGRPVNPDIVIHGARGLCVAVHGVWIVYFEALLVLIRGQLFLRPDFRLRRLSSSGLEGFHLLDEVCHYISVLEIIVSLTTVAGFHLVNVVQALERVSRNMYSSTTRYILRIL